MGDKVGGGGVKVHHGDKVEGGGVKVHHGG